MNTGKLNKTNKYKQIMITKLQDFFRDIKYGIHNMWKFRNEIWNFRTWDYHYNLFLFAKSIELTADKIEKHGNEVDEMRMKRIEKMRRFVWLIRSFDDTIPLAENELGPITHTDFCDLWEDQGNGMSKYVGFEDEHTSKVYARSRELDVEMWDEICHIFKGNSNYHDGTGIRGWWD